jgi:hypothetical protein
VPAVSFSLVGACKDIRQRSDGNDWIRLCKDDEFEIWKSDGGWGSCQYHFPRDQRVWPRLEDLANKWKGKFMTTDEWFECLWNPGNWADKSLSVEVIAKKVHQSSYYTLRCEKEGALVGSYSGFLGRLNGIEHLLEFSDRSAPFMTTHEDDIEAYLIKDGLVARLENIHQDLVKKICEERGHSVSEGKIWVYPEHISGTDSRALRFSCSRTDKVPLKDLKSYLVPVVVTNWEVPDERRTRYNVAKAKGLCQQMVTKKEEFFERILQLPDPAPEIGDLSQHISDEDNRTGI